MTLFIITCVLSIILLYVITIFKNAFLEKKYSNIKNNTSVFKIDDLNYQVSIFDKQYRLVVSDKTRQPSDYYINIHFSYRIINESSIYNFPDGSELDAGDIFPGFTLANHIRKSVVSLLSLEEVEKRRKMFEEEMYFELLESSNNSNNSHLIK